MEWSEQQVETWLSDGEKCVTADIVWSRHSKSGASAMFEVELEVSSRTPMRIKGFYSPVVGKLSFAVIAPFGRIYGLCLGDCRHFDPASKTYIQGKHKHKYKLPWKDRFAYVPDDIQSGWSEVKASWLAFCAEARIRHEGEFSPPSTETQGKMFS